MIKLTAADVALIAAAVARVSGSEAHSFVADEALDSIAASIGDFAIEVYDRGPRGNKIRCMKVADNQSGDMIEIEVCPQPEFVNHDNRPDGDGPGPNGAPAEIRKAA